MEITLRRTARGWLKPAQAAKYAGVSLKVFRRWMKEDGLSAAKVKVGKRTLKDGAIEPIYRYFLHYDDVDTFMEQHREDAATKAMARELTEGL